MESIRVFRIITRLMVGGPAIHTTLLTEGLNNDGFQSSLICGTEETGEGNMAYLAQSKGIQPIIIPELRKPIDPIADRIAFMKLYRLMKKEKPHIVHTHLAKAGALGRLAAKMAGVPIIVHTYHGYSIAYYRWLKTQLFLGIDRSVNSLSDRIVAISDPMYEDLVEKYKIAKSDRTVVINLGLELEGFMKCDVLKGQFRREMNIPDTVFLVGIVGRLVPVKNHRLFLSAVRKVAQQIPNAVFLVIGDGELRQELEEYANEIQVTQWVRFLGWRKDLDRIYADLDCVALTSNSEGTPVALIEALSARCPVVSTDVGGVKEVVEDEKSGYLVEPDDSSALANAIIDILSNPDKARRMAEYGHQKVTSKFASSRLVSDIRNLYMELLIEKGIL